MLKFILRKRHGILHAFVKRSKLLWLAPFIGRLVLPIRRLQFHERPASLSMPMPLGRRQAAPSARTPNSVNEHLLTNAPVIKSALAETIPYTGTWDRRGLLTRRVVKSPCFHTVQIPQPIAWP